MLCLVDCTASSGVPRLLLVCLLQLAGPAHLLCGAGAEQQLTSPPCLGRSLLVLHLQGGPIPGNEEFKVLFEAAVGRAYKCESVYASHRAGCWDAGGMRCSRRRQADRPSTAPPLQYSTSPRLTPHHHPPDTADNYRMDIVPSAAPLSWYKRNPASIWINGSTALLQVRRRRRCSCWGAAPAGQR